MSTLHENLRTVIISRSVLLRMKNVLDESCIEYQNISRSITVFPENRVVYETMWKNMVHPDRPQMTM